jgi:hypothetical protein
VVRQVQQSEIHDNGVKSMKKLSTPNLAATVLAITVAAAAPAQAQGSSDGWQFEAAIYGWFPSIGGTTAFPPNGGGPSIDVSTGQVIDALQFAFMGSLQARNGAWGVWTCLLYTSPSPRDH